jgi:hypothetical protein
LRFKGRPRTSLSLRSQDLNTKVVELEVCESRVACGEADLDCRTMDLEACEKKAQEKVSEREREKKKKKKKKKKKLTAREKKLVDDAKVLRGQIQEQSWLKGELERCKAAL